MIKDEQGRFIILYVSLNGLKLTLANIYAPNTDSPEFFITTFKEIHRFSPDHLVIAGDLNLALNSRLDRFGCLTNNEKASTWLNNHIMEKENFVDVWRWMKPDENGYTWHKLNPKPKFSRLDYVLVTEGFLQFIKNIEVLPEYKTDHSAVMLTANFGESKRGPGYWKLNNSLLRDPDYVEKIAL